MKFKSVSFLDDLIMNPNEFDADNSVPIFSRPPGQLQDFPIEYRWELSRRHPIYLLFWKDAVHYFSSELGDTEEEKYVRHISSVLLQKIGITGKPIDPSSSIEELMTEDINPAWLSGSVTPPTVRGLVIMLLEILPPAERAGIGAIFSTSGLNEYGIDGDNEACYLQKIKSLKQLQAMSSSVLDSFIQIPLVNIHVTASQRTIERDLGQQLRYWKKKRGITEQRLRTDKLPLYLTVWDLREGWTGGGYDYSTEKPFDSIAKDLKEPLSTIISRYKSAFAMITGHPFSPESWWRFFGVLYFSSLFKKTEDSNFTRVKRRMKSPSRVPIPETVLKKNTETATSSGVLNQLKAELAPDELKDFLLDFEHCMAEGLGDEEIAKRLEIADPKTIPQLRMRWEDLKSLI